MSKGFGSHFESKKTIVKVSKLRCAVDAQSVKAQWLSQFQSLKDPRKPKGTEHNFLSIVLIAILATIGGATGWEDIEDPAAARHLAGGLELALGQAGHEAMGFAVHVPHYLTQVEFPRASLRLLEETAIAGDLDIDLLALAVAADDSDREIDEQVSGNAENVEAVRALEAQYDAVVRGAENALQMAEMSDMAEEPIPSGDEIAAQLEAFLREMDDDKGRSE